MLGSLGLAACLTFVAHGRWWWLQGGQSAEGSRAKAEAAAGEGEQQEKGHGGRGDASEGRGGVSGGAGLGRKGEMAKARAMRVRKTQFQLVLSVLHLQATSGFWECFCKPAEQHIIFEL